jgi:hypothetical protein
VEVSLSSASTGTQSSYPKDEDLDRKTRFATLRLMRKTAKEENSVNINFFAYS